MKKHLTLFAQIALIYGLSFALGTSCAKKREAKLPDDQINGTFAISEIESTTFKVSTAGGNTTDEKSEYLLTDKISTVLVDGKDAPQKFKYMFNNLEIPGKNLKTFEVVFASDRNFLTAYKVASLTDLTPIELSVSMTSDQVKNKMRLQKLKVNALMIDKTIASQDSLGKMTADNKLRVLVPLFKYKIQAHGVVEPVKNELKEETSVLKLRKSEWENSTHIQISELSHDRINMEIEMPEKSEKVSYFLTDKINNQLLTHVQIKELFSLDLEGNESDKYYVTVNRDQVGIYAEKDKDNAGKNVLAIILSEQLEAVVKTEKNIETNTIVFKKTDDKSLGTLTRIDKK